MATLPTTRRFTGDEVLRMVEVGILDPHEPVELLDGELVTVSPQGLDHASVVRKLTRLLVTAYPADGYAVQPQCSTVAGELSLPEPDLAVLDGPEERFSTRLAPVAECLLVIEVSVTSQALDRRKVSIYARAGAPRYWRLDVPGRLVEVMEGPRPDGTYASVRVVREDEGLELPGVDVPVALRELLPAPVA